MFDAVNDVDYDEKNMESLNNQDDNNTFNNENVINTSSNIPNGNPKSLSKAEHHQNNNRNLLKDEHLNEIKSDSSHIAGQSFELNNKDNDTSKVLMTEDDQFSIDNKNNQLITSSATEASYYLLKVRLCEGKNLAIRDIGGEHVLKYTLFCDTYSEIFKNCFQVQVILMQNFYLIMKLYINQKQYFEI